MNFYEIENLSEEVLIGLYDDILEYNDNSQLAGCCCSNGDKFAIWSAYTYGWSKTDGEGFRVWCDIVCRDEHNSTCQSWGGPNGNYSYCGLPC